MKKRRLCRRTLAHVRRYLVLESSQELGQGPRRSCAESRPWLCVRALPGQPTGSNLGLSACVAGARIGGVVAGLEPPLALSQEEPWVHFSGCTVPVACLCRRSLPIDAAALTA